LSPKLFFDMDPITIQSARNAPKQSQRSMKLIPQIVIALAFTVLPPALLAETPYERELRGCLKSKFKLVLRA